MVHSKENLHLFNKKNFKNQKIALWCNGDMLMLDANWPGLGIEPGLQCKVSACYPLHHGVI